MQIDKPVTSVDTNDPLLAIRQNKEGIQSLSVENKVACKHCEWKYWCAGGCPLANYRAAGQHDAKSFDCNISEVGEFFVNGWAIPNFTKIHFP